MKELIQAIAMARVDQSDDVQVRVVVGKQVTVFESVVHPDDLGKVIGRQGAHGSIDPYAAGRDGDETEETLRAGNPRVVLRSKPIRRTKVMS